MMLYHSNSEIEPVFINKWRHSCVDEGDKADSIKSLHVNGEAGAACRDV